MFGVRVREKYFSSMEWLGGKLDLVKITWQKSLAGLGAAQRIDSSYSDERNDLTGKISDDAKFEFQTSGENFHPEVKLTNRKS